jgi:hypothetical protein
LSRQEEQGKGNGYQIEKSLTDIRILLNRIIGGIEVNASFFSMLSEDRKNLIDILEGELERRKNEDSKGV